MQNPYAPPETLTPASNTNADNQAQAKPIIPALIGIFTYGSSSPYALVLCVEQYLQTSSRPISSSTNIAFVLSLIGSFQWFAMTLLYTPEVINLLMGNRSSMYAQLGLMIWMATIVFLIWLTWRIVRYVGRSNVV